jgi:hypothetical protein
MADLTITGNEVTVQGPGFRHTVTVAPNESVADALTRNGIDTSAVGGIDLLVGGQRVDAADVRGSSITPGETLASPPKSASLG